MTPEERVQIIDGQICLNDSNPDNAPWVLWRDNFFPAGKETVVELIRQAIAEAVKEERARCVSLKVIVDARMSKTIKGDELSDEGCAWRLATEDYANAIRERAGLEE